MNMRVLYAIQGTGNGHIARARAILPELIRQGYRPDILISGMQSEIDLPYPVRFRLKGIGFIFGKRGGIDLWQTYWKTNSFRIRQEIRQVPVTEYDLVLNDFEPITAWACRLHKVPCIGISHQAAVLAAAAPQAGRPDWFGKMILRHYAPVSRHYGFHFQAYEPGMYTPVIREEIRKAAARNLGHYTVYLPAYSDSRIIRVLSGIPGVRWEVFSKHCRYAYTYGDIGVRPISDGDFVRSLAGGTGILCNAGFETPSEAIFLGKKLCVIPMKSQLEQQCNAAALAAMGIPVLESLNEAELPKLIQWIRRGRTVHIPYADQTPELVERIFREAGVEAVGV